MRKLIFILFIILAGLYFSNINAAGWYDKFHIAQVQHSVAINALHLYTTDGSWRDAVNPDGCDMYTKFILPHGTEDNFKAMTSSIYMAFAANRNWGQRTIVSNIREICTLVSFVLIFLSNIFLTPFSKNL